MGALTPFQKHLIKRGHKHARLIKLANQRLEERRQDVNLLPPHHVLGVHLGLIVLVNCSRKLVDVRARARWMLHWMLGYLIAQGYTLEEASTENALDALEALVIGAVEAKTAHENHLKFKMGQLLDANGMRVEESWRNVYDSAMTLIGALENFA